MTFNRFELNRQVDISGVSGTGLVAVGVEFPTGKCVVNWLGKHTTVTVYDSIEDVKFIHLHGGNTILNWIDI